MKKCHALFLLIAAIVTIGYARTAGDIKADLESIAPADKTVKIAFSKGGYMTEFPHDMYGTSHVYVCSSEDGVVRRVNGVTGGLTMVNLSADGTRVFFFDWTSYKVYAVDWDGQNEREVLDNNQYMVEYWRDPSDGSDWVVTSDPLTRINVDNTSEWVTLSSMGNGDGSGLSDDGTMVLACCGFGLWTVPDGPFVPGSAVGGCMGSVRAGPLNQYSSNISGHAKSQVTNPDGSGAFQIPMAEAGNCVSGETGRWTQHPDYFTFMRCDGNGESLADNPALMRITDEKVITIEDDAAGIYCGDMDAVFLPPDGVGATKKNSRHFKASTAQGASVESFTINGRRRDISQKKHAAGAGIVIQRVNPETMNLRRNITGN